MSQAEEQKRQTRDNWVSRAGNWNDWAARLEKQQKGLNEPLIEAAGSIPASTSWTSPRAPASRP
ncbi:MAG: hypothetical protein QF893_03425 [Alphaproteobacteria bacterium]|nr:hypothetical protein [Alphaproteobacteria bacterium]